MRRIHGLKTAALIAAATEVGALAAGAGPQERERMRAYGDRLGLCFQAVDDLLDVTGNAASLGKTPGKDAAEDKATLVAAMGLRGARAEAELHAGEARRLAAEVGGRHPELLIDLVRAVLERSH